MNIVSFFISSLIIILIPGTGVIYTISTGITKGKKASVIAALGCTAGIMPHLCLSISLSSLILQMNSWAFNIVKIAGALYLLYLGIGMIVSKSKTKVRKFKGGNKSLVNRASKHFNQPFKSQAHTLFLFLFTTICSCK